MKDNKYYCEHLGEIKGTISTEICMTHYKGNEKCSLNLKDIIDEINNDRLIKKYVKQYRQNADIIINGDTDLEYFAQILEYMHTITNNFDD